MKIKTIALTNFAKYDAVKVSFDDNITYLIGKNGSGKSTLGITAIWFMFQGIAEKSSSGNNPLIGERFRFIGPKGATAKGEMLLLDEKRGLEIKVTRKLTKTGSDLSFEAPEGYELNQSWLTDLFNIFLIAPKKFTELSPKEQAVALGIDTKEYDAEIASLKTEFTLINREIKSFGEIVPVEKVEKIDLAVLQQQKETIQKKLRAQYEENKKLNLESKKQWEAEKEKIRSECDAFNVQQTERDKRIFDATFFLTNLRDIGYAGNEVQSWIDSLPKPENQQVPSRLFPQEPNYVQEVPDDSELIAIDEKIITASQANEKAFAYEQYQIRLSAKQAKEKELTDNKKKQADKETERINYIKKFKFPFSNLSVDEEGGLLLNNKPLHPNYFSTGELLKIIPLLIASQNPELKYVFLQDFNLMDEERQADVEKTLTEKGFQLVIELVGKEKLTERNCILLRDNVVVENYEEVSEPQLV